MAKTNTTAMYLHDNLIELRLPSIRECFAEEAERARKESLSYEEYLLQLLIRENEDRRERRILRFLRESKLPLDKNLESFDQKRLPKKVGQQLKLLLEGKFIDKTENVLAFGTVGSGKSHLLCAIGQELIYQQERRAYFTPCDLLVQDLLIAKRELKLKNRLKYFDRFSPVIIDDIGYVKQDRDEMEVLFSFLAHRYERGSVMITSNLPFSGWESIFKDPMTTAAAIDRLVHHSVIIELNLPSYRLEHSKVKKEMKTKSEKGGER